MLSKVKTLEAYKLDSLDGEIGKVKEFYFDDRHCHWRVWDKILRMAFFGLAFSGADT